MALSLTALPTLAVEIQKPSAKDMGVEPKIGGFYHPKLVGEKNGNPKPMKNMG